MFFHNNNRNSPQIERFIKDRFLFVFLNNGGFV
jgi:hypothetical protein